MLERSFGSFFIGLLVLVSGCATSYEGTTVERAQGFVKEAQGSTACLHGVEKGTRDIGVEQGTNYDITVGRNSRRGYYYDERQSYHIDSYDTYKCRTEPEVPKKSPPAGKGKKQ